MLLHMPLQYARKCDTIKYTDRLMLRIIRRGDTAVKKRFVHFVTALLLTAVVMTVCMGAAQALNASVVMKVSRTAQDSVINAGEDLTWEDVSGVNWSVMGSSSPAGYIYPSLWLQEQFDKNITELPHAVQSDSYGSAFARLASGQIDVLCTYADARRDYADKWTSEYAMTNSIWEDTAVIGVTPAIYNDTISVSKSSPIMDDDFKTALSQAFINIGDTEEGKAVISIYSHQGYQPAQASDYDSERAAQKMIQELNSAA